MKKTGIAVLSLLVLSACNQNSGTGSTQSPTGNPGSTSVVATPSPDAAASPSPATTATPKPSASPSPTATPEARCPTTIKTLSFEISKTITRSARGLTEGLQFEGGMLWESTGLISGHGASVINKIDPATGTVTRLMTTPSSDFGEGLVKVGNSIYQLTYTDGNLYQYTTNGTAAGTTLQATHANPLSEGWGFTTDGTDLIASDGSSYIYRLDPATLKVRSKFKVVNQYGNAITGINELEYVNGQIYANIFPSKRLIRFDAELGCQNAEYSMQELQAKLACPGYGIECDNDSVSNGIAYDSGTGDFYLTGKSWPSIYQGKFK